MLTPLETKKWDRVKAAHLLNRAGFGGTPEQIEQLHHAGLHSAVEQLLNGADDSGLFPAPTWAKPENKYVEKQQLRMEEQRIKQTSANPEANLQALKKLRKQNRKEMQHEFVELIGWWLDRMQKTPFPFREKMTLFWHGHFATSIQKVRDAYLMYEQNETLRRNALGSFRTMAKAISRDPAMLIWLDGDRSEQVHPNENFGRECLELFTLGVGNFTEADMHASSRAFTGYRIDETDQAFRFSSALHDYGQKTFLGKTADFDGDGIIDRAIEQPASAKFMAKKFLRFFVVDNPSPTAIDSVARSFRQANYEMKPLMREIFLSVDFYSPTTINSQIKSPVQWMVQAAKELETDVPRDAVALNALTQMGQILFEPPNVKGWNGGKSWITTSTLFFRYNFANYMIGSGSMRFPRGKKGRGRMRAFQNRNPVDFAKLVPPNLHGDHLALVQHLAWRLYQQSLTVKDSGKFTQFLNERGSGLSDQTARDLLHLLMSTPEYQLA